MINQDEKNGTEEEHVDDDAVIGEGEGAEGAEEGEEEGEEGEEGDADDAA